MFVYLIVNSETLKLYIGQHKGSNLRQYLQQKLSEARRGFGGRSRLYASMRKHPREAWSIWPLVSGIETRAELDELEKHFIRVLKTQHPDVGYNICEGGEGFTGPHTKQWRQDTLNRVREYWKSPEARIRRSQQMKDRWKKDSEFRQKMVELGRTQKNCLGRVQSEEEKMRRSVASRGKQNTLGHTLTEEHKRKISKAGKGRGLGIPLTEERKQKLRDAHTRCSCPHHLRTREVKLTAETEE